MTARRLDQSAMKHLLGYAVAQARVATTRAYVAAIGEPLDLRPAEFSLLMLLLTNPSVTQKELAAALNLNAPNLTLLVVRLEERKLVQRERSDSDRRAQFVRLSAAGRTLAERARKVSLAMESPIRARYSDAEWAILLELLQRVAGTGAAD
jgi:DNA-binding MarR family transcriptional regulator